LKRSLQVIGQSTDADPSEPEVLQVGDRLVTIRAVGSGSARVSAARFASFMLEAGGERSTHATGGDSLSIVIREGPQSSSDGEADADYVLGSARPAFARCLVEALEQ
jgi:hypothetical protein